MAGEQHIFSGKGNRPGEVLDAVAIHFDAAVGEEEPETVPVAGYVGELLAEAGLGRDAGALLLQPFAEGLDHRRGAHLSFGETPLGWAAAYTLDTKFNMTRGHVQRKLTVSPFIDNADFEVDIRDRVAIWHGGFREAISCVEKISGWLSDAR